MLLLVSTPTLAYSDLRPWPGEPARPLCSLHKEPLGLHSKQAVFCRLEICQGTNLHIPALPSGDRRSKVTDLTLPKDAPCSMTLGISEGHLLASFLLLNFCSSFIDLILCVLPTCTSMYHVPGTWGNHCNKQPVLLSTELSIPTFRFLKKIP